MGELKREEVLVSQVIILLLTILTSMGILEFGPDELMESAGVITSAVIIIYEMIGAIIIRYRVTPVSSPRDSDGNNLVPEQE